MHLRPLLLPIVILHSSFITLPAAPPPELTVLRQQYEKIYAERVTTVHEASVSALNTKFTAALDNAIAAAQQAGKLDDILAIQEDKKRLGEKLPIPDDDDRTPESLKSLRAIYREQLKKLEDARAASIATLLPAYQGKLQDLETTLTKAGRIDEAKELRTYREGLATGETTALPAATGGPSTALAKIKGDDRKAAEWILTNWSDHRVFANYKHIKTANELPKGRFSLTSLSVDGRFYTGKEVLNQALLMEHLGGLSDVEFVGMGGFPDLKDEDFAFISTLPSLREIKLSKLACTDAFLAHLKGLKKLRLIDMSELMGLTGIGFSELSNVSTLERISHFKGGMTDDGVAAVSKLVGISHLDIQSSARVSDACIPDLRAMGKLTSLFFSASGITPEGFEGKAMPKITTLAGNALGKLSLNELAPKLAPIFPNIENFYLTYLAYTPQDVAALSHFKKLMVLTNAGEIKEEAVAGLLELQAIEIYRVYFNEISPATWQALTKLKKLKRVYYGNKPPNDAALAAFKKERPDVKLEP